MAAKPEPAIATQAEALAPEIRETVGRLADENALLRASLAEMRERLAEFEQTCERDPLTGLANASYFRAALERVVSQANRHGTPAALLPVHLDGLAALNHRHGCLAGDAALLHVARLLRGLVRTTDLVARTGGDQFALILDHLDQDSAVDTAERIVAHVAAHPLDLGGALVRLRPTVAVAAILRGDDADEVAARAERNLERMKSL